MLHHRAQYGEIPEFKPSAETELLCLDLNKDANGRVFAHLLRQVDVAKQQNGHIIREQMKASENRDQILVAVANHVEEFRKHEANDVAEFKSIRETVKLTSEQVTSWARWLDFFFSRNGVLAVILGAVAIPLAISLLTASYKSKLDAAASSSPASTNSTPRTP